MADYNGYLNRATWSVALNVGNIEPLYRAAVDYARGRVAAGKRPTWGGFVQYAGLAGTRTTERFSFAGRDLDRAALRELLAELATD